MALTKAEQEELELLELEEQEAAFLEQEKVKKQPTVMESAIRKAAQGGLLGLSDEAAGVVEAGGRLAGIKGLGGPMRDISVTTPTLNPEDLSAAYTEAKEKELADLASDEVFNPITSNVAEIGSSMISPLGSKGSIPAVAMKQAAIQGYGESEAETPLGDLTQAGMSGLTGLGLGKIAGKISDKIAPKMTNAAEKLAENATGATAVQAQKFAPKAGRELLDRGVVAFGDTPEKIAAKSETIVKQAERTIESMLKGLDDKGVQVNVDDIVANIQNKAAKLSQDPSQADVVRKLNSIVEDIVATKQSKVLLSDAEITKRGYNRIARNWLDPEKGQAGKIAYLAYRDAVENAAQVIDPSMAKQFIGAKKVYGLMNPIQEAAERRAAQLNQSPLGGLLDVASIGVGSGAGGVEGAVIGAGVAGARRFIAPRLSSSMAVTLDQAAKKLPTLSRMTVTNPNAANYLMEQLTALPYVPSPYEVEQFLRKDPNLKPSERAKLLKENSRR